MVNPFLRVNAKMSKLYFCIDSIKWCFNSLILGILFMRKERTRKDGMELKFVYLLKEIGQVV